VLYLSVTYSSVCDEQAASGRECRCLHFARAEPRLRDSLVPLRHHRNHSGLHTERRRAFLSCAMTGAAAGLGRCAPPATATEAQRTPPATPPPPRRSPSFARTSLVAPLVPIASAVTAAGHWLARLWERAIGSPRSVIYSCMPYRCLL